MKDTDAVWQSVQSMTREPPCRGQCLRYGRVVLGQEEMSCALPWRYQKVIAVCWLCNVGVTIVALFRGLVWRTDGCTAIGPAHPNCSSATAALYLALPGALLVLQLAYGVIEWACDWRHCHDSDEPGLCVLPLCAALLVQAVPAVAWIAGAVLVAWYTVLVANVINAPLPLLALWLYWRDTSGTLVAAEERRSVGQQAPVPAEGSAMFPRANTPDDGCGLLLGRHTVYPKLYGTV